MVSFKMGFPGSSAESTCQCRRQGSDVWSGRSSEGGNGNHSSILVWRIPWAEEPSRPQSMGSQRIRHDWAWEHKHHSKITPYSKIEIKKEMIISYQFHILNITKQLLSLFCMHSLYNIYSPRYSFSYVGSNVKPKNGKWLV